MASGSYLANGTGGRKITGLGFRPDVVLVKGNDYDTGLTNTSAVMRTSTMSGDASKPMVLDNNLATNQITSLDADGFTLGNDRRVAANGVTFYWAAFKANANTKVGTYTGNGTTQSITSVGFSPDFLIVMPSNAARALQACSATPTGRAYEFDIGVWLANQISSLDANGFTVNHNTSAPYANVNGVVYHYVAWNDAAGLVKVGSYQGNAIDRMITGIGFRPEFLFVKFIYNVNSSPNLSPPGHFRTPSMPFDYSHDYARTFGGNHIRDFLPDGFQIGSATTINQIYSDCTGPDGPGCEYFYVAINNVGPPPPLATTQTSTTITVTDPNSFEMTFDQARGGNLANFYDLAEDPVRAYDLAGKPSVYFNGLFHSSMVIGGQQWASGTNSIGAKLELLEATPTRVRVRQEAFYQQVPTAGTARLAAAKGIGDYSVYPEKVAIRWNRRTWAALAPQENALEIGVRRELAPDPRDAVTAYSQSGSSFPAPPTDDFVLAQHEVPGVRTDMLAILYKDWPAADSLTLATTAIYFSWRDNPAAAVPADANDAWDLLIHYKPTNFLSNMDPAVISRRADYRTPDSLAVMVGGPWTDASENTGVADAFNEAEAAYTLTFDPALGLQFDMNGSPTNPRYQPFFKIRQWRSLNAPAAVVFEGATLAKDVDYRADVKPVSRAHFAAGSVWHSTLESATQVSTSPDIGGPGFVVGPPPFVPARYGNGVDITLASQYVAFDTSNFNKAAGAIEFWFQPAFASTDGALHDICGFVFGGSHRFVLEKRADDNLYFSITAGGPTSEMSVSSANYSWQAGDWVHLRIEWNDSAPLAFQQRLTINGVEPTHTDPTVDYASTGLSLAAQFRFGNTDGDATFAPGLYDEIYVYGAYSATPIPLADGGLTSSSSEYLADSSKNFGLSLAGVDASRRGAYFYLGSDSKVRGLNVALQTQGAGVAAGALQWEYWNGTAWVSLETVGGFADTTNSLTTNGSVYWTGDPAGWAPYSVNGGPDLYYLRVHLALGATYTTAPVESLIKTDILLFQYFGDVTAPAQTFQFPVAATADLAIAKSDGNTAAVPGTGITYTIRVTNNGPDTVASVVVTDSVAPAGGILSPSFFTANGTYDSGTGTWIFSSALQAGQYAELTLTGTIDPLARNELWNTATVAPLAGIVDTNTNNNSATDIDTLTPSVDVALTKTAPATVGLGSVLTYTLDVTSGPSGATGVRLTDPLPPNMLFVSATPASCSYDGPTRTVTCNLGDVASSAQVTLSVRPMAVGTFRNTAVVQSNEDPAGPNNTAFADTTVEISTIGVKFFTVTSTDKKNVLEWVNPTDAYYDKTEIRWSNVGFPADETQGNQLYYGNDGGSGGRWKVPHDTGVFSNGLTFYYAAFVHRTSTPSVSPGRFCTGRPFDSVTGPVKWAFSTGATAMTPPTVGGAGVVAPSNDRVLYAMERGSGPNGGEWPSSWRPIQLQDVVQSRSPVVPVTVGTVNPVVYLGDQLGNVYAVDAVRGGDASLLWGGAPRNLGLMVQAAPAGIFKAFDPSLAFSYLLLGTRDSGGYNAFYALDPFLGTEKDHFDDFGVGLGVISGMAAVDYATRRVYFASRERVAGGNTLWCLEMKDTAPYLEFRWARALGDIDSSPVLRKEPGGAAAPVRVYVGSPLDGGTVFSIDALSGDVALDRKFLHNDGQVKGFVFPDRNSPTGDIYFATENSVWGVSDTGGSMSRKFPEITLPGVKPSAVLFVSASQRMYFGGSNGMLHEIDVSAGATHNQVLLGGGPVTVGAPSYDWENELVHVGTEAGVFYAVQVPLLSATCVPAASCTGVNVGQPCYISNPAVECSAYHCLGAGTCGP